MATGIANVKGKNEILELLTTTTAPTESGGVITISTSNISGTPKVNSLLAYIDSDNISALYKITAISSGTATLSLVGNVGGGGGKQLYQHNWYLKIVGANATVYAEFKIINDVSSQYSFAQFRDYIYNHRITGTGGSTPTGIGALTTSSRYGENVKSYKIYTNFYLVGPTGGSALTDLSTTPSNYTFVDEVETL